MPASQRVFSTFVTADVTLPLATETVVATLPGLSDQSADAVIHLIGHAHVTTGVGATTVTPRIRRTGLTGTLVGEGNAVTTAASATVELLAEFDDSPGDVSSLPYVLTMTAAGVAGTMIDAYLQAVVG